MTFWQKLSLLSHTVSIRVKVESLRRHTPLEHILNDFFQFYFLPSLCQITSLPGSIVAGYVPLTSQSPYPIIVYSMANYRLHLSRFGQMCKFRDPNLVTLYSCMYLILNKEHLTFHLQYKHSGMFADRKHKTGLSSPKNRKPCDPILVTFTENATPCMIVNPVGVKIRPHPAAYPH